MCGCVIAVFRELNSLSTTASWGINLFKHQTCARVSHQHQAGINPRKSLTKGGRWSLLWGLCVPALQLQLHKEANPTCSHIVPQVLAMNRFYHSQSHRRIKPKCACWKAVVWHPVGLAGAAGSWGVAARALTGVAFPFCWAPHLHFSLGSSPG